MSEPHQAEEPDLIHWTSTTGMGGHLLNVKIRPGMLLPSGEIIIRRFKPTGRYRNPEQDATYYRVVYDRSYVANWLLVNVLDALPGITHAQARELLVEAFKLKKERLSQKGKGDGEKV